MLSHPEKILIPDLKITKQEISDYYETIQKWILPHVADRPLSVLRCPEGVAEKCFFQKNLKTHRPPGLFGGAVQSPHGGVHHYITLSSVEGLLALAQMDVLEIHAWGTHRSNPLHPDLIVFDLDPGEGVAWKSVVEAAYELKEVLHSLGLESYVKVTGGKGFHIHVPIAPRYTWDQVKSFSKAVSETLVKENPERYIGGVAISKRRGKIFIDTLRNSFGATSVAPYSTRARLGGCIALPIRWKEVAEVEPCGFTLRTVLGRFKRGRSDPWVGYFALKQNISLLKKHALRRAA